MRSHGQIKEVINYEPNAKPLGETNTREEENTKGKVVEKQFNR